MTKKSNGESSVENHAKYILKPWHDSGVGILNPLNKAYGNSLERIYEVSKNVKTIDEMRNIFVYICCDK